MRALSLFSNCGAGDLGYRSAGFEFQVMAELQQKRLAVSLLNHPSAEGVPGDLTKTWQNVVSKYREKAPDEEPDLIAACPPCQGMSSAHGRRGAGDDADSNSRDERNLLVVVIASVVNELHPKTIVVENVPAFLTRKISNPESQQPISAASYLIGKLKAEYEVFPFLTDLCDYGIPQTRKRSFLTFIRRDIPGLARLNADDKAPYPRPTHAPACANTSPVTFIEGLRRFTLPSLDAKDAESAIADGFNELHFVPIWKDRQYAMVEAIPPGGSAWETKRCPDCGEVEAGEDDAICRHCRGPLLRPVVVENGVYRLVKGFKTSSYCRMKADQPAATITTASGHVGSDLTIHPTENRVLSPLECAILQTFPKSFKWGDTLQRWGHTHVRAMIGEAVPPRFTSAHGSVLSYILGNPSRRVLVSKSDERCMKARQLLGLQ